MILILISCFINFPICLAMLSKTCGFHGNGDEFSIVSLYLLAAILIKA